MSDPHEREDWENQNDLGDTIVGAGRVLIALTIIGVIGVAVILALSGCGWRCAPGVSVSRDAEGRPVMTGGKVQCMKSF